VSLCLDVWKISKGVNWEIRSSQQQPKDEEEEEEEEEEKEVLIKERDETTIDEDSKGSSTNQKEEDEEDEKKEEEEVVSKTRSFSIPLFFESKSLHIWVEDAYNKSPTMKYDEIATRHLFYALIPLV